MKYKLLVIDVDGTLLNDQKQITPHTKAAILKAQQMGVHVVLASGRPTGGILPLAQELELNNYGGYVISYNGAQIIDMPTGKVLFEKRLNPELIPYLDKKAKKNDFAIFTYLEDFLITDSIDDPFVQQEANLNNMHIRQVSNFPNAIDFEPCKCILASDNEEELVGLENHWKKKLAGVADVFRSEDYFLEVVPPSVDKGNAMALLMEMLKMSREEVIAIGDGIATAINRIKDGKAKSKSIILLTDGTNNSGVVAPLTAAEIAQKEGIRIYTIGLGTRGTAETPYAQGFGGELLYKPMPVTIDEESLKKVAQMTGGKYFRATDNDVLTSIFNEIDKLEKTKIDVKNFTNTQDNYMPWAWALLLLVLLNLTISYTVLRRIP